MKCKAVLLSVLGLLSLNAAEPGLLFHAGFDSYVVDADFAKGNKKGYGLAEKDLQLRMFPGPRNKGNSLALGKVEKVRYKADKNIDPRKGTVSFWMASRAPSLRLRRWMQWALRSTPSSLSRWQTKRS